MRVRCNIAKTAEDKQKIIIELYDKFFKVALPKEVEKLGIVYTPVEVVDFILNSVNDVLKKEFNRTISSKGVHVLDPFAGTGTFLARLIQSGLIQKKIYCANIKTNSTPTKLFYLHTISPQLTLKTLFTTRRRLKIIFHSAEYVSLILFKRTKINRQKLKFSNASISAYNNTHRRRYT